MVSGELGLIRFLPLLIFIMGFCVSFSERSWAPLITDALDDSPASNSIYGERPTLEKIKAVVELNDAAICDDATIPRNIESIKADGTVGNLKAGRKFSQNHPSHWTRLAIFEAKRRG